MYDRHRDHCKWKFWVEFDEEGESDGWKSSDVSWGRGGESSGVDVSWDKGWEGSGGDDEEGGDDDDDEEGGDDDDDDEGNSR